jgi:hypothetical protein
MANPDKTNNGELVSGYQCDPATIVAEFELSKRMYASLTGRKPGRRDVYGYHIRQSFAPNEIDAETANRIGYELAKRFSKGLFAFAVYTHTDRKHIHNHILLNSTALDCKRKFRSFLGTAFAVRRISDTLCVENGLSIIENPQQRGGRHYGEWISRQSNPPARPPGQHGRLKLAIDCALEHSPQSFGDFVSLLAEDGYETKRGKHTAFREAGQSRFMRLDSLGGEYSEAVIRRRVADDKIMRPAKAPNLLVDIERKLREGKGEGYRRWASVYNLKQMAQTLIYLQGNGIDSYDKLSERTAASKERFNALTDKLNGLESTLQANSDLQKQIVTYAKTKPVYNEYRQSAYSKKFRAAHEPDILLHRTAKKYFDGRGLKKLPTVKSLREEYAPALEEKRSAYREHNETKSDMRKMLIAKENVDRLMNLSEQTPRQRSLERERER